MYMSHDLKSQDMTDLFLGLHFSVPGVMGYTSLYLNIMIWDTPTLYTDLFVGPQHVTL